jgi:PAS domain S-box-containing protein
MKHAGRNTAGFIDELNRLLDRISLIRKSGLSLEDEELQALVESLRTAADELQTTSAKLYEQNRTLEESLEAAEREGRRFRELFEFAPDGYIVTTPAGVIQEANQIAAHLLNASSRFLRGRPLLIFVDEHDQSRYLSLLEKLQTCTETQEWELCLRPAAEKPAFDAAVIAIPQREDGRAASLRWTVRDITERKRMETMLRTQRDRVQKHLDSADIIILVLSSDEGVEIINRQGCELLGCEQDEIVGKNWFDHFIPENIREDLRAAFRAFVGRRSASGRWSQENPILSKDGTERLVDWRNVALTDEDGRITGVLSSGRDVTARRRVEERLRREKEFSDHLINSSTDGIIAFDPEFRCTAWNPIMEDLSGVPAQQVLGQNIFGIFPFLQGEAQRQAFLDTLSGKYLKFKECPYMDPSTGRQLYIDSEFSPIRDLDGRIVGGLVLVRDVTERKLAEESLRESEARYRRLSENLEQVVQRKVSELQQAQSLAAIGQVVSVVAHEIRNPLQNINMGVDILKSMVEREAEPQVDKLEILSEVTYGVDQLNMIVNDLLEYSRPVKIKPVPWQFRDLLDRALTSLSKKLRNINVELSLEHGGRPLVGDPHKLKRVLLNIIDNAAGAMPKGGTVSIHSHIEQTEEGEYFFISIKDTGVGMDEETLKRLPEPFFTTKAQGTGLGLSICYKIIDAHSGKLRFHSRLGEGTTVEILLPISNLME